MCWFKTKIIEYKPISSVKATGMQVSDFIRARFTYAQLWISDSEFTLCHYDDVAYFLAISQIDKISYKAEEMDCDDFAAALWGEFSKPPWSGLAIGLAWTEVHALNFIITEDWKWLWLEPQSDELLENLASWQGREPRLIIL